MKRTPVIAEWTAALAVSATLAAVSPAADKEPDPAAARTLVSTEKPAATLDVSLRHELDAAVSRALDWLAARQKENGSWSNDSFPALTGLALWAFAGGNHPEKRKIVDPAVKFILSCVKPDGGIYREIPDRKGGGLSNYNTAICMTALHLLKDSKLTPVVLKAREFVAGSQHFGDDIYDGGMGYDADTKRPYADLMNSVMAFEAMRLTEDTEDLRPRTQKRVDLNWRKAREFLRRLQNREAAGKDDAGGFPYRPDESKAGVTTNEAGVVVFRSYGSMTYAGLLALIYAEVDRNDPRVKSAFDWSRRNWSLKENPGMGDEGLYFFLNVLTKALAAYGQDRIQIDENRSVNWRSEVARRLIALQKIDPDTGHGFWVNNTGRFWEADPVLATAYSTIALQILVGK